mgnify:FL=1
MNSVKGKSHSIDRLSFKRKIPFKYPPPGSIDLTERSVIIESNNKVNIEEPKTSRTTISKAVNEVNTKFEDPFKYNEKDVEYLSQHPLIRRRANNWGESLSPEYLVDLKKKQRQKEYWKQRIKNDFKPAIDLIKKFQKEKEIQYLNTKKEFQYKHY